MQNIFYLGNKRKMVPLDDSHLERFFDSVSVLMSNILRQLALDSIADYSELFSCDGVCCVCVHIHVCMYPRVCVCVCMCDELQSSCENYLITYAFSFITTAW